jgi:hypothetical protein
MLQKAFVFLSIVYYSVYVGQFKFALWLAYWYLQAESFGFDWDEANSTKSISKHGVPSSGTCKTY